MNVLFKFSFLLLTLSLIFTSCAKEERDITNVFEVEPEVIVENKILDQSSGSSTGINISCIEINFPFEFATINSSVVSINNIDAFNTAINDSEDYVTDFIYPLTIVLNVETIIVNDIQELGLKFAECIPDQGWTDGDFPAFLINEETSCFSIVYPINLKKDNGDSILANSETGFIDAIASGYEFFAFPITLVDEYNYEIEVTNSMTLFNLLNTCEDGFTPCECELAGGYIGCYTIVFPIQILVNSNDIKEVNNVDELHSLILNGDELSIFYPLTVTYENEGIDVVIYSDAELYDVIDLCVTEKGTVYDRLSYSSELCYEVVFPLYAKTPNGSTMTINNYTELYFYDYELEDIEVVFPFTIDLYYGQKVEVQTEAQFIEILEEC